MNIGQSLKPCTTNLQHAILDKIPNRPCFGNSRIVIVDTPGFGDTYENDEGILERIGAWLVTWYVNSWLSSQNHLNCAQVTTRI